MRTHDKVHGGPQPWQELRDDLQMMVDQGHKGFKVKIGGLSLKEDMERLRVIREVIGEEKDLMVDVNRAWDFKTACRLMQPSILFCPNCRNPEQ